MNGQDVDAFLSEIKTLLKKYFKNFRLEILFKTHKSLKAHIYLAENFFITVRYNARNERTDFALIYNNQRVFGYDNLKVWHYHPLGRETEHIPCNKPTIDKIIFDIKEICKKLKM